MLGVIVKNRIIENKGNDQKYGLLDIKFKEEKILIKEY